MTDKTARTAMEQVRGARWARGGLAIGAITAVVVMEVWTGGGAAYALVYLPLVVAAAWGMGLWSGLLVLAVATIARGVFGVVGAVELTTDTLLLAALVGAVAKIRSDRHRTERFRQFVHGLLERQARTARRDALTGLTNRRGLFEQLHVEFARWERGGPAFGVIYLDIDNFKQVNDRFGHDCGDEVLCEVADRIDSNVKETDVTARIGGDEFVILCWNATREVVHRIAERLERRLAELGDSFDAIDLGVSLGVACFDEPPDDIDQAVRMADEAMYQAKEAGGRDIVVWEPSGQSHPSASDKPSTG